MLTSWQTDHGQQVKHSSRGRGDAEITHFYIIELLFIGYQWKVLEKRKEN